MGSHPTNSSQTEFSKYKKETGLERKDNFEKIKSGKVQFFSHTWLDLGVDFNWITNPETNFKYDIAKHWSEIESLSKDSGDIKYVWEKANLSKLAQEVIVATDDKRIKNFCMNEGIKVLMTSKSNKTGTDRIYEVSKKINFDIYCNVQGDEPLINPKNIDKVILCLKKNISKKFEVATGYSKIEAPSLNKYSKTVHSSTVFLAKAGKMNLITNEALYFWRGLSYETLENLHGRDPLKHIGLYAYTKAALKRFHNYKRSPSEISQGLEQMRFIENKEKIICTEVMDSGFAVDYPSDIKKIVNFLKKK